MKPPGLEISGLTLAYGAHTLFRNLALEVPPGRFMVMLGASGVGKSSLLRVAAGLAAPLAGRIAASDGQKLDGRIAWMGQQDLLYPWLSILDNVMLGARLRRQPRDRARWTCCTGSGSMIAAARCLRNSRGACASAQRSPARFTTTARSC